MSRFYRYSIFSAKQLYDQQVRRAWLCFWLSWVLLIAGLCLLHRHRILHCEPESHGISAFWAEAPAPSEPPLASPAVPPLSAAPRFTPKLPQLEPIPLPPAEAETVAPDAPAPDAVFLPLLPTELMPTPQPVAATLARQAHQKPRSPAAKPAATAAQAAASSAQAADDYSPPAYRSAPSPPYPAAMRQSHLEGSVRLRIFLDADGSPLRVEIAAGSGHAAFDTTARDWVLRHWSFTPARQNGRAVPGTVVTTVRFVLD